MNSPLDKVQIEILRDILKQSLEGCVNATEYRRKNTSRMSIIKKLADTQLLRHDYDADTYRLSLVGLYLTDNSLSNSIFNDSEKICAYLRKEFTKGNENHSFKEIQKGTELTLNKIESCIHFLRDVSSVSCNYNKEKKEYRIQTFEGIFEYDNLKTYIERFLPSWFPDHFGKTKSPSQTDKKTHGNTEINASKREDVLRAAIAVLAEYPEQCKTGTGKTQGKKIANILEQKSLLLFPNYDGEPPLSTDKMTREINKCLKLLT